MFEEKNIEKMPGHWLLAKMGKKVLRPGGKELTVKMIRALNITASDDIVEFAPGLGYTASLALAYHPLSYTGIDADGEAVKGLRSKIKGDNVTILQGDACQTTLVAGSKDKVYGEAMLTMQVDHRKAEIIGEAARILKKGGLYGIHELALTADGIDEATKAGIQKDLARVIKVNARPLTSLEWQQLLEANGFVVRMVIKLPMHLLESAGIISDEGFFGAIKIAFNIMRNPEARKRILAMRRVFKHYGRQINALAIIAEKI